MTEEEENRRKFLAAYEALGPGGLSHKEIIELADLNLRAACGSLQFDNIPDPDKDDVGEDEIIYQYCWW